MTAQSVIFGMIGGLGMFLYGMRLMSEGLQKAAGNRMRKILEMLTSNRLMGILVGTIVTSIVQSSSATTVMVVGFVNAGLMNLGQSISVVLGCNIGTTVTGQLIAFQVQKYALPAIGIGVLLYFFGSGKTWKSVGQVLLGFGLLFLGISIMKDTLSFLKESEHVRGIFASMSKDPWLGLLAGLIFTLIVQSSSATVGVTMALASTGLIDFTGALPIILGDNIGTTITANIASIGTSVTARRTARAHALFNIFGAAYMMALFYVKVGGEPVFLKFVDMVTPGNAFAGKNIERHIANMHTFFNVFNVLLFLPLMGLLERAAVWAVPGEVEILERRPKHIDKRMLEIPSLALDQAKAEVIRMAGIANEMVDLSMAGIFDSKKLNLKKVLDREEVVNELQKEIIDFLVQLEERELSKDDSIKSSSLMHLVNDIEKIGDYAENIVLLAESKVEEKIRIPEEGLEELRVMHEEVILLCQNSVKAFETKNYSLASKVLESEAKVDIYKVDFRANHIKRLKKGGCESEAGLIFVELISNLERIGDHGMKMANWLLNERDAI